MCRIFEEYGDERAAIAKAEGRAERNIEVAEKMLKDGSFSIERIADIADLPLERVREIAESLAAPAMA